MSKMNSPYVIQTIPHNLSQEETIVQMVEILDHLNCITQDIFCRINKRLDLNSEKLANVSKRIDTASSKLERLKGDKKAKTVFSSSKYPAVDINQDYISIFKGVSQITKTSHAIKHPKYIANYEPLSKLQFYHVKMPEQKNFKIFEGLGEIPGDSKYITDLLLFNTGKNIYVDFRTGDSFRGPEINNNKEHYTTSELGDAPVSISQRSSMRQVSTDNYFYTPKIEELPALDVPWDLPDLPGIADDVRYEIDSGMTIAPSLINSNQINELNLPNISEVKTDIDIVLPLFPQAIPEPPPMMPLIVPSPEVSNSSQELSKTVVDSVPKIVEKELTVLPPPPPPVISLPKSDSDSRASLMDAIRKAGGSQMANLRKTSEQQNKITNKSSTASGDFMADLHSKLMMRRKGISGTKNTDQGNGSNLSTADLAFARLSSIIPTKNSDIGSSVSTDDDDESWNDDD